MNNDRTTLTRSHNLYIDRIRNTWVMTQELEFEPLTEADKSLIKEAQIEEEKYKEKIPTEFYTQFEKAERQFHDAGEAYSKMFGKHVELAYNTLRKADIPAESAKKIVIGRFTQYRSIKRIRVNLPDEAKSKHHQEMARRSNAKQKAEREESLKEAIIAEGKKIGIDMNERVISGSKGGTSTTINKGIEYMTKIGSKGGSAPRRTKEEKIQEAARLVVAQELTEQVATQPNEIVIELPAPDFDTEEGEKRTIWSCKIQQLWNKYSKAYLTIDVNKKEIVGVFNRDEVERPKELEDPVALTPIS